MTEFFLICLSLHLVLYTLQQLYSVTIHFIFKPRFLLCYVLAADWPLLVNILTSVFIFITSRFLHSLSHLSSFFFCLNYRPIIYIAFSFSQPLFILLYLFYSVSFLLSHPSVSPSLYPCLSFPLNTLSAFLFLFFNPSFSISIPFLHCTPSHFTSLILLP